MKILLINQPLDNRGDEAAHKALVRTLLKYSQNVQIRVLIANKSENSDAGQYVVEDERVQYVYVHSFLHASKIAIPALTKKWKEYLWNLHPATRQIKRQYEWADLVVCAPGGICMGGFQNWDHLYFLKWAQHCKKPLAYYGRSFGPFPEETELNRQFKKVSYEMLHYFSYLSIRDKVTEHIADEIGIPYVSTIDTAFLDNPDPLLPYEIKMVLKDRPYMVFVPNCLLWHPKYAGKFSVEDLVTMYSNIVKEIWKYNKDLSVVMLPQTFGSGQKLDDLMIFRMIAEKLNDDRIIVLPDCYSSDIQQRIIRGSQFVIGARYHSIVFAINQGVPVIALSYEHKIAGLLQRLDMDESMIDFSNIMSTPQNKARCLNHIAEMLPKLQSNEGNRTKAKIIALEGFNKFAEQFGI